ncbi:MAG: TonB-dependent receptor [Chitinophagaceae bacterium]|nr:TonB-dependent receptor [Chitinophagaceae bacterium]
MKKFIIFFLFISSVFTAHAQNNITVDDSVHIIELQGVSVSSIKRTAQQQLFNFFKTNNASTLEDILSRLPEISLLRRGAYGMEPSIRYFSGGQINVLVDGMQIHGACTDKMDPATIYIEPINLQNLQVQTAGNGFINGSSIGGTVNMKMAEPDYLHNHQLTGVFNSGYQTAANNFYESLRLNYSAGKWAIGASGTYRNSKNYRSGGGKVIPFSQYEKVNYSLSVKFQQDKYTYFKADVLADDGWNIGYAALPMDVGYAAARIASVSMYKENSTKRLYKWQTKIYANSVRHFMDDTKRPFVPMHMDMPGESKTVGIYTEGEIRMNRKQKIIFRADGASTFLKASMTMYQGGQLPMYMLTWPDNRKNQLGTSASWLWQPDSLQQLKLSGRIDFVSSQLVSKEAKDQVSIFDNAFEGRKDLLKNLSAQISKKISRRLKVTSSIGYSERMPTATELFGFYLFNASDGYDYIGNPKLKTERALQADVSVLYSWQRSRIQVTAYCSKVNNVIAGTINPALSTMTIGASGVKSFVNIPYAIVAGAEVGGFFKPMPAVDIVSTIRYTLARDNKNDPLPFVAPIKNITAARYQPKNFSMQLESEAALSQNQVSRQYGEDATAGFVLLHCRLGYNTSIFKNNVELQAGVENIFDKKYHEHLDWGNIARPGRNLYVQLKVALNN